MGFRKIYDLYNWDDTINRLSSISDTDVLTALEKTTKRTAFDFLALISPNASKYLEKMACMSQQITQRRFGKTIQMYIPMYLSNMCQNICTYCGFSFENKIDRLTLNEEQILKEVEVIKSFGYDHILLVTGEVNKKVSVEYFEKVILLLKNYFSHISIEVQPLQKEEYERLIAAGLNSVLVYQETYHEEHYKLYHLKGKKTNFNFRLDTPDRLGNAGIYKIGIGALLGLENWRVDSFFVALHLDYLEKMYWKTKFSISFPRLRPAVGCQQPAHPISDKDLVQLICAYRLLNENIEISLSSRENPYFRDNVFKLGITHMSAGSKTDPGGYALKAHALEQFEVSDDRTPQQVANAIKSGGYEVVWKDWDRSLITQ